MPPVVKVGDRGDLVDASTFPLAKFPFDKFNPVQSRILEYYDKDNNILIATATSSGKTVCAEMVLSHEVRKRKGKGLYLVPLKALAQEKIDDWQDENHHFGDLKISVCTGDYRLTAERKKELEAADLIVMSYEMFNSRVRNLGSERSEFLMKVGTLVADEVHLLTVPNRGDHLEAGMMRFTEINKNCRLVFLSATMPNVDELADWTSFILNNKHTVLLKSTYRPCPLNLHYEKYWDGERSYDDNEKQKVNMALEIVEYYPDDKFLIFSHTKKTCALMKEALTGAGIKCEVHNADLDKAKRNKVEKEFKTNKNLRVIVATSTLAWGLNLPARRVIILGVHRGLDEVATYDIWQMFGRAGRPAFDPVGDAYVLLPEKTYDMHKERIKKPQLIQSQMLAAMGEHHKVLAFHLVSEIHQETIKNRDDVHHWYKRSLACFQANELDESIVDHTMELLKKCGAVWEEEGQYTVTSIGKIASLFYFSPFDVSDLKKNFTALFDNNKENDDLSVAVALANLDTHRFGIVSKAEREEMSLFANQVHQAFGKGAVMEPAIKVAYAYHQMMNGNSNPIFVSLTRGLHFDFPRLNQVIQAIDGFTGKWQKTSWLRQLQLRVTYGVKGPMVELCQLPHIGKVRANKLWKEGLRDFLSIINSPERVRKATGLKTAEVDEILAEAKRLFASSS
jgi:helicase